MIGVLTVDYELFGSGKGDVIKHVIEPTKKMLKVFREHNVKATFFVEQLEVAALLKIGENSSPLSIDFINAKLIKSQITQMVEDGHDIQLHLHPQWYNAYYSDGVWRLNFDWWRFSSLPYRTNECGTPGRLDLLIEGKRYLEEMIKPIKPEYQCTVFRAGGYNLGLDDITKAALLEAGFLMDSSICPGFFSSGPLSNYDYTGWLETDCLSTNLGCGVSELPLITINSSFFEKISFSRIYSNVMNRKYKSISYSNKDKVASPEYPERIKNSNFDFCLSSYSQIFRFVSEAKCRELDMIILIGHSKDYSRFSPLKKIIKLKSINFKSIQEIANYV
jgi:hypothetical protein